jgi:diacylglycerol kinase (ATP)
MKVTLIVNPKAGNGGAPRIARRAAHILRETGLETRIRHTGGPDHASELAAECSAEADLIAGVGGDGTLSELVNGLRESHTPCTMIPCGTGNDFSRFVGIPDTPDQAARRIAEGGIRPADAGLVKQSDRLFVNTIGVGFDAAVARRINQRRRISRGLAAYLPAIFAEIVRSKPLDARISVDGREIEGQWLLIAVANGHAYGAGFQIAPKAVVDDGLLDVVLVGHTSRLDILRSLNLARHGRHESHPKVTMLQGSSVRIETPGPQPALLDGDIRCETPLDIEIQPGAVRLWT